LHIIKIKFHANDRGVPKSAECGYIGQNKKFNLLSANEVSVWHV